MEDKTLTIDINIPFSSERLAQIAYDVLRVDKEPKRSAVNKNLSFENNNLKALFSGESNSQLRVAVNCFFDNINLILETYEFAKDPVSEKYSHY